MMLREQDAEVVNKYKDTASVSLKLSLACFCSSWILKFLIK